MFCLLLILSLMFSGGWSFEWSATPGDHEVLVTCAGSDLTLPFNYSLTHGQQIVETTWIFQADGRAGEDIAILARGHFVVMPAFSGRVQRVGEAGLEVSHVGVLESGNYTVIVTVEGADHFITRYQRTVFVQVAAPPQSEDGSLHVQQTSQAVYDVTSGQWRVPLTCGRLTSLGQPPVDVVWTTPSGQQLPSNKGDNGTFTFLLPNPPSSGNYSCSLSQSALSPAASCLPPHSPLLNGATLTMDEVKVAFAILDARQTQVMAVFENKTQDLQAQLAAQSQLHETDKRRLDNTTLDLQAQLAKSQLHRENLENTTHQLQTQITNLQTENDKLKADVATLKNTTLSCNCSDKAAGSIAFHAKMSGYVTEGPATLRPWSPWINIGNGLNANSGMFTAPLSGLYFFAGTTGTATATKIVSLHIYKEGSGVCYSQAVGEGASLGRVTATCHAVVQLTRGQRVWLYSDTSAQYAYYYGDATHFTGFLLHAD